MSRKFSESDGNYKPTAPRSSMTPEHKKYEEKYTEAPHEKPVQNQQRR